MTLAEQAHRPSGGATPSRLSPLHIAGPLAQPTVEAAREEHPSAVDVAASVSALPQVCKFI